MDNIKDKSLKINIFQYHVVGRATPTDKDPNPNVYRMCIFAKNDTNAKSRFWYFMKKIHKLKKSNGELLACEQIREKNPLRAKTYGVLLRYDSRTGTHNMYKEFRDTTKEGAIAQLYSEMAGRHRARASSISIIRISEISIHHAKRPHIKQLLKKRLRFPALHLPTLAKEFKRKFAPTRPSTYRM
ncbi:60S ribosomal protein L18, putative [Plasmodium vinckei]|uniref:60S ribosomal protein L18a n=2 Tax=Plasmodium vinckei TaxID=5860 RepID=W7ASZ0_PLAVN|nr:50S ribosomal protein L18Ae [Plasmodium vinckei petteri]CAD2098455.1 60S ribosomal protein L18, putative [Plasmodium vinckei petteri]CAD2098842.1 60S ribosomal protein L18, putative [Plasmodium vinckei]